MQDFGASPAALRLITSTANVALANPEQQVIDAMIDSWRNQQLSRGLREQTVVPRSMARRFLSEADMDPKTRTAGLLVLLYGLQLTRIVTLTRDQVDATSRPVKLTIRAEPIELPSILGNAITELVDASARHPEGWLFPGRNPGLHLTPGPLGRRLREQGLRSGSTRTTTLIELTRQMHPRIVSALLGITPQSAAAWSRLASGDWTDYPQLRSAPK